MCDPASRAQRPGRKASAGFRIIARLRSSQYSAAGNPQAERSSPPAGSDRSMTIEGPRSACCFAMKCRSTRSSSPANSSLANGYRRPYRRLGCASCRSSRRWPDGPRSPRQGQSRDCRQSTDGADRCVRRAAAPSAARPFDPVLRVRLRARAGRRSCSGPVPAPRAGSLSPGGSRSDWQQARGLRRLGAQQLRLKRKRTIDGALGRPKAPREGKAISRAMAHSAWASAKSGSTSIARCSRSSARFNVARVQKLATRKVVVVGLEVGMVSGCRARRNVSGDGRRDGGGDLGLDVEDIGELAVEGLGPELSPALVEQLRRDAQLVARLAHAALQHMAHTEHRADALDTDVAVLERERGSAADHVQLTDARERVQDLLGDAVAEVAVRRDRR